jgi:hypothetical protein
MKKVIISLLIAFGLASGAPSAQAADLPGLVPSFGTYSSQLGGFTVQVTNYSSSYSWAVTTSSGTFAIDSYGLITISGLGSGATANVSVTTTRSGYVTASNSTNGMALERLLSVTPYLSAKTPTRDGFTVQITNYSSLYIWTATSSTGTVSQPNSSGLITVSGAPRGQQVVVTVYVNLAGYTGTKNTITYSTLPPPTSISPTVGNVSIISNGFTIPVTNFDDWFTWTVISSSGQATIDKNGLISVTGNDPSRLALITMTATYNGSLYAKVSTIGYSNSSALKLQPVLEITTDLVDGFQAKITNYDPLYTWSVSSYDADVDIDQSGLITASGMDLGQSAEITIMQRVMNGPQSSWTFSGNSFEKKGFKPTFGSVKSGGNSFSFMITNYNTYYDYEVKSTSGKSSISASGLVTISGLKKGGTASVTVFTSRDGNSASNAKTKGAASLTISAPSSGGGSSSATPAPGSTSKPVTVNPNGSSSGNKTITCKDKKGNKKFVTGKTPVCPSGYTKQ